MREVALLALACIASVFKSRAALYAENLALRHQLCVFQRSVKRAKVKPADRLLWSILAKVWGNWKGALIFVKPDTVIRWQRRRFREHWTRLSQQVRPGRPTVLEGSHQSMEMDAPEGRTAQTIHEGKVIAIPHVGGLHYNYERKAA